MSFPPPVVVYPNAVTAPQQNTSHSKGSFGPVFAVLAVVVVLSAIACVIGQICARRFSHQKQPKRDSSHQKQHKKDSHPKQHKRESHSKQQRKDHDFHNEEGDIEFGFQNGMPMGKPSGPKGPKPSGHGGHKGVKFADEAREASAR